MERIECCECGVVFGVPENFNRACREAGPRKTFYCPNGHPQSYRASAVDVARREAERLKQQLAERDDAIREEREAREAAERRASAAKGQVTRLKNRAKAGVCPCCNRHFTNLQRHMETKHPNVMEDDNVIPLAAQKGGN